MREEIEGIVWSLTVESERGIGARDFRRVKRAAAVSPWQPQEETRTGKRKSAASQDAQHNNNKRHGSRSTLRRSGEWERTGGCC